jgi:hypothetical protein
MVLTAINKILYNTVFFVTNNACPDLKKNSKFFRPFHGLLKIPPA